MAFVVAIDGPAGSGKGTITKAVGKKMGLVNIDTGAMYRCVSLYMVRNNIKLTDLEDIQKVLDSIEIKLEKIDDIDNVFLNGENVSKVIREKEVNDIVSPVSQIFIIRKKMVELQRKMGEAQDIIMEGRDIGTSVFPNADVKIYLDASPEERANRRLKQNKENGINQSYEEILQNIIFRDKEDSSRTLDPLKQADDAIYLDSTNLSIEEVTQKIIEIIKEKRGF